MEHDETAGTSSWKSRNCSLGPGEYARSWSLTSTTADTQVLSRRVAMWIVIVSRLVQTIIIISYNTFVSRVSSIVFGVLFGILSFLFVVWCLTVIDRAQGRRKLCGLAIVRGFIVALDYHPETIKLRYVITYGSHI